MKSGEIASTINTAITRTKPDRRIRQATIATGTMPGIHERKKRLLDNTHENRQMIISGYPIDLRNIHRQIWWNYRYLREVKPVQSSAKLTLLYFSYSPDFPYLSLSIKTLLQSAPQKRINKLVIAEDQKAPFSAEERAKLSEISAPIQLEIYPIYDFAWGSPESTYSELQLFQKVANSLSNPADLVVKCDSDVLFIPSCNKWEHLLDAPQDAFGDGHFLDYKFAQGGLYFLRKRLIESVFPKITLQDVKKIATDINSVGEDMAITEICRRHGRSIFFTRTMLFPTEYGKLKTLSQSCKREFMALHCHKDKQNMPLLKAKFLKGEA